MKKVTNSPLFLIIITALLTYGTTLIIDKKKERRENRPRIFDKSVNILHQDYKELEKNKWQLLFDGKPLHSYNDIHVSLYNFDDLSFEDVPVYISIAPQEGDSLHLMNVTINGATEGIKQIADDTIKENNGKLRLHFFIHTVNQTKEQNKPFLDINIHAISSKTPINPVIAIDHKGIQADPEEYTTLSFNARTGSFDPDTVDFIKFICLLIPSVIIVVVLIAKLIGLILRPSVEKKEEERLKALMNELKEEISKENLDPSNLQAVIKKYNGLRYRNIYKSTSIPSRWISNMRKPEYFEEQNKA